MSTDARTDISLTGRERRDILRDSVSLISASNLATICGAVTHLALRAVVEPGLMGIWSMMRTLLECGTYSSLGVNRAAARDIAIAAGRGDESAQRRIADVTMSIEVLAGCVVALALLSVAAVQAFRGAMSWAEAFCTAAVIAAVGRYHAFSLSVLRSHKRFDLLSRARVVGAAVDLSCMVIAAGVLGLWGFGFYGMIGGAALAQTANACYVQWSGRLRFGFAADRTVALGLLAGGWPIAGEALALLGLRAVDRFVIVGFLPQGVEQLGWYSVAMVLGTWTLDQANLIATVLYPRLAERLGKTSDPAAVLRMGLRAAELLALAMVPCAAALLSFGVPMLDWLLPKYRPGLVAAGGLVAGAALLGVSMPLRYALVTIGRSTTMLVGTAGSACVSLGGGIWLLRGCGDALGGALARVAWNSAAAAAICLLLMVLLAAADRRALWSGAARVLLASAYAAGGVAAFGDPRLGGPVTWTLLGLWCVLPIWLVASRLDWSGLLRGPADAAPDEL